MSNQTKTHYRKVFKSDHLGKADIEDFIEAGSNLIFTIKHVRQEYGTRVAGRKIDGNFAYFEENIKPLVLNAGNSKIVSHFAGSNFVDDWNNITVQLYVDANAKLGGEVVGGVRISPIQVQQRQVITKGSGQWNNVITAYKRDGNFDAVLSKADISQDDMQFIVDGVTSGSI